MAAARLDALEAATNALVGLAVSWAGTLAILPLFGMAPSPGEAAGITACFFALSTARAFVLRRLFRRLG